MLSVIIPALNEAQNLPGTLRRVRPNLLPGDEVIVVDGGSADGTADVARKFGAKVVAARRGRGTQMNAGAAASAGDVLLFLHADTHLPPDAGEQLRLGLRNPDVLGGNFLLLFDAPGALARLFAVVYNARSRRQRVFYGDSAIWVRRDVFDAIGGFGEATLMEDVAFCRALYREAKLRQPDVPLSKTLPLLDTPVVTSARRFHGRRGQAWRLVAVWSLLHVLYAWGVPTDWLERRFYPAASG